MDGPKFYCGIFGGAFYVGQFLHAAGRDRP